MAEMKTIPNEQSVQAFLAAIPEPRRQDCLALEGMMQRITGAAPRLWGTSIVGFGSYHYRYDSGREGDWFLAGFSPRKNDLTLYVTAGLDRYPELLKELGKHKTGKSCLYIKRLSDVDEAVLEELVGTSVKDVQKMVEQRREDS